MDDREISSSQLGMACGWDWTCMQLNDGTEVGLSVVQR